MKLSLRSSRHVFIVSSLMLTFLGRYGLSADMDDRTMHEIYWWPFLRSLDVRLHPSSVFSPCANPAMTLSSR